MLKSTSFRPLSSAALVLCAISVCPAASAECCPGNGHGVPKAASGMGEAFPQAPDLAADAAWQVYEFERDGMRYLQVNDQYGKVRAAVGRIGGTFWVLPIGGDANRVSVPGDSVPAVPTKSLYRANDVEVVLYRGADGDHWIIRSLAAGQ